MAEQDQIINEATPVVAETAGVEQAYADALAPEIETRTPEREEGSGDNSESPLNDADAAEEAGYLAYLREEEYREAEAKGIDPISDLRAFESSEDDYGLVESADVALLTGERGVEDETGSDGYAPPTRPDWIDDLPIEAQPRAESLFNGMAKLHRETAQYRAMQSAIGDPDRSTDAVYAQIDAAASRFGMSAEEYLPYVFPGLGAEQAPNPATYDDFRSEPPVEAEYALTDERVIEALENAGVPLRELQEFRVEREISRLEGERGRWIEGTGRPLAAEISRRSDGFPVTGEMLAEAREFAHLRGDGEALADPILALKRRFPDEWADHRARARSSKREKGPTMTRSAGSSPTNPDFDASLEGYRRFAEANPTY